MRTVPRKLCFLFTLLLICLVCVPALAVEYNAGGIYTISYDAAAWQIDDQTYSAEATEDYMWLFMLYSAEKDALIDASIEAVPEFEGLTLFTADEARRAAYLNATMDAFADQEIRHLTTLTVSDYQIPFYVYVLTDEEGPFLYAETIVNGSAVAFGVYFARGNGDAEALLPALEEVLATFAPVIPTAEGAA